MLHQDVFVAAKTAIFERYNQRLQLMYMDMHVTELQLLIAVSADQAAYRELFLRFQPRLKKFVYSLVHTQEVAEEIVSDVFVRIWVKRQTLDYIHNLKLYLYVAAKNLALNYLRREKKQETIDLNDLQVELVSANLMPDEWMITREMARKLEISIQNLPPKCKVIFKLIKEDGLKQREVAELLNLSVKTVENQLALAVKKIGQSIAFKGHASADKK